MNICCASIICFPSLRKSSTFADSLNDDNGTNVCTYNPIRVGLIVLYLQLVVNTCYYEKPPDDSDPSTIYDPLLRNILKVQESVEFALPAGKSVPFPHRTVAELPSMDTDSTL